MAVDFCDYFWGEEHNGWNVLHQNMKQGLTAGKELTEFFKERGSVDEVYSKTLLKLATKTSLSTEKGTCTPLFHLLKNSTEKLSVIHSNTVQKVQELVREFTRYNDELHKKQKNIKEDESATEEIVKGIQTTGNLALKAKEVYCQRYQDLEKLKRDSNSSLRDTEKAEIKLRKSQEEYKILVEKYNLIREEFEEKMTKSCRTFQEAEEYHISQMLHYVHCYIRILMTNNSAVEEVHQELIRQYSSYSIKKLLDVFVLSKFTGLEKPNAMTFEDSTSLGSGISGQQSPDLAEQVKSCNEDGGSTGGGSLSGSSGVLGGGIRQVQEISTHTEIEDNGLIKVDKCLELVDPMCEDCSDRESVPTSSDKELGSPITSPTDCVNTEDDQDLFTRFVFRNSKMSLAGGSPILPFGFLRSRREKRKEKKNKKKKETDSSSNKEERSDNECSEEMAPKTTELVSVDSTEASNTPLVDTSERNCRDDENEASIVPFEDPKVDEEGFSIIPLQRKMNNSSFESSDSESDSELERRIHVKIKPLVNGTPQLSASIDELRATIEGMTLSPQSFTSSKRGSDESWYPIPSGKANHVSPVNFKSGSNDLLGINLSYGGGGGEQDSADGEKAEYSTPKEYNSSSNSPATSNPSVTSPVASQPFTLEHYSELNDILNETNNDISCTHANASLKGSLSSRGSTPTASISIPRPPSRRHIEGPFSIRGLQSPAILPRAESASSLEHRPSVISRGPSPLTLGMSDTIPLAVAFQELCHVYFRGSDEKRCQVKVTGEMMMSFPAAIVNVLTNNPCPAKLCFRLNNGRKLDNIIPNKQLIMLLPDQQKVSWQLQELSNQSQGGGTGSLRAKLDVAAGPSTPATVSAQFHCEGTTISGLEFGLVGNGYRISLIKRRFVSGKYICDADAVLELRYGTLPS